MIIKNPHKFCGVLVAVISLLITVSLACSTYTINFWPSDSYYFYIPTAAQLFDLRHLSQMHDLPPGESIGNINMHGKEALILGIAIMQKILGDPETLYPNVLLLILALQISAVSLYFLAKRFFGPWIGFLAFFLFVTSFWPYVYVLQGAHQPLVLMFFLLTIVFWQNIERHRISAFFAGTCFGFMLFSSPTAFLYIPYFLFFPFISKLRTFPQHSMSALLSHAFLSCLGCAAVILLFTYPHPLESLSRFVEFVSYSQFRNHFDVYNDYLSQNLPQPYSYKLPKPFSFRGAGWIWVLKYCLLIVPIMFSAYLASLLYFIKKSPRDHSLIFVILISLSTPLAVETAQVSQFGRNYFSWIIGMILLICYAVFYLSREGSSPKKKSALIPLAVILLAGHLIFNLFIFLTDVFPAKMSTTTIQRWLAKNDIKELLVYDYHRLNQFTVDMLNNPKEKHQVKLYSFATIRQMPQGYIFFPPYTDMTIWTDCASPADGFFYDPYLKEIIQAGKLDQFVVASFPSLSSSRIWMQEEEVCTYRGLVLGQRTDYDERWSRIYILDAEKIQKEWFGEKK